MKMLVSLDGSSFAEKVLPTASALAYLEGGEVTLITVIKESKPHTTWASPPLPMEYIRGQIDETGGMVPTTGRRAAVAAETRDQAVTRAIHEAGEYLADHAKSVFPQGVQTAVLVGEDVAGELVAYAREHSIDLIAMATHGRTGLGKLVMGSVASKVLESGVAPVLLVRPDDLSTGDKRVTRIVARGES